MIPDKTIKDLITKHSNLERELSSQDIDKKVFAEIDVWLGQKDKIQVYSKTDIYKTL